MDLAIVSAMLAERGQDHVFVQASEAIASEFKPTNATKLAAAYKALRAEATSTSAGAAVQRLWKECVAANAWYANVTADAEFELGDAIADILGAKHTATEFIASAKSHGLSGKIGELAIAYLDELTAALREFRAKHRDNGEHTAEAGFFSTIKDFINPPGVQDLRAHDMLDQLARTGSCILPAKELPLVKLVVEKMKKRGIGYKTMTKNGKIAILLSNGPAHLQNHPSIYDSVGD